MYWEYKQQSLARDTTFIAESGLEDARATPDAACGYVPPHISSEALSTRAAAQRGYVPPRIASFDLSDPVGQALLQQVLERDPELAAVLVAAK